MNERANEVSSPACPRVPHACKPCTPDSSSPSACTLSRLPQTKTSQLWDRKLRAQAAAIIDEAGAWLPLWWLSDVRTARGATGMLYRCWPGPWALFSTSQHQETPTDAFSEEPVLVSDERPTQAAQLAALNGALAAAAEAERQRKAAARKEWWGR